MRVGEFNVHYGSIYIRTEKGAKLVEKYPYARDRWILEKLILQPNPEILNSENGTYEPIFVFQDNNGKPLPVVWRAVEYIMFSLLYKERPPKVDSDTVGLEKEKEKDANFIEEYLDNKYPEMAVKLKEGSAVSLSGREYEG